MIILYILLAVVLTFPIVTKSFYSKENLAGALLCLCLAVPAHFLGKAYPVAGGPVVGILIGIIVTNVWKKQDMFSKGIKATAKRVLQMAIVLFGFQMNFNAVIAMGSKAIVLILCVVTTSFTVAFLVGKLLKMPTNEKTLIGVGTAICGGSAIAAVSPILEAEDKEVVRAISTIFLFNIIAAFLFPALGRMVGMSDTLFGMWAGSAINDTSSVVAAGYAYSDGAGDIATIVKLTRTIMIIPVSLIIAFMKSRKDGDKSSAGVMKSFPWFVLAFLVASIVNTTGIIPADMTSYWSKMGKFLIIVAMVAIGFGCDINQLIKGGKKSILLGLCCSLSVAIVSITINMAIN